MLGDHNHAVHFFIYFFLSQAALRFVKGLERAVSGCGQPMEGLYLLVESIHSPYCQSLVKYHNMELQLLRHQLHSIQLVRVAYLTCYT